LLVTGKQAELAGEAAIEGAILCSACGCVWVRDPADRPHLLGTLRRAGRNYTWSPACKQTAG
jgi:hypothetical protein